MDASPTPLAVVPLAVVPLPVVRAALATAAFDLASTPPVDPYLGPVTLYPHQRTAAARLRRILDTHGGALLTDAVGLGKTWVALALLRHAHTPVVIAPAALRRMWLERAAIAHVHVAFHSTESLSALTTPALPTHPDLVVIDEAHHFRTPTTRRRAQLATLCAHARVLLLSATPVHNATHDLTSLLALFLGEHAATLAPHTLAHLIVRRRHVDVHAPAILRPQTGPPQTGPPLLPAVLPTAWHCVPAATAVYHALRVLPPPLPPADGGHAPTLATLTLIRLWTSSDAALRAALRRRITRAAALDHALTLDRYPDRRTLSAWAAHDAALQLPLFLDGPAPPNAAALAHYVAAHTAALHHALATLDAAPPADPARIAWLQAIRARHPAARIVAFTQFADTARATFRTLASAGHIGLLTAGGGRIASGPLTREALLARFAPLASGAPDPPAIERVDCLVTTDCLSEGLDLRDASVVVHLDLPWTPARLAQRVGRAARLGAPHTAVHVYALRPDPHVAHWLRLARRLRTKARAARHALGMRSTRATLDAASQGGTPHAASDRRLARHMAAHRLLERWLYDDLTRPPPPVAAVRCGRPGFLAVCHQRGAASRAAPPILLAALDRCTPTAAPGTVLRALRSLACDDATAVLPPPQAVAAARAAVAAWLQRHNALAAIGMTARPAFDASSAALHRTVRGILARADRALRTASPHTRASRAVAVDTLRHALDRPLSAAAEHALAQLEPTADDETWLTAALAAVACTAPAAAASHTSRHGGSHPDVAVLVLLVA